jgi:hypothetical protein
MALLNVAESAVLTAAPAVPFTGTVETTVGAATVVKVQTKFADKGVPARSFAPAVMVAIYRVPVVRTTVGANVAVVPAYVTVAATEVAPGPVKVNVATVIVAGSMTSLNVAEMGVLTAIAVAPLAGIVEITVGGGAVVKFQTKFAAKAMPLVSRTPVVTIAT